MAQKIKKLALLGKKLGHTFSPRYFADKFSREGIDDYEYGILELENISQFPAALSAEPDLAGLNVTIPYKTEVIEYLDSLDETAAAIGAVNTIRIQDNKLTGYNTDVVGFRRSLDSFLPKGFNGKALILGTGGSSKAVRYVLEKCGIPFTFISRKPMKGGYTYDMLDGNKMRAYSLIINTTPVGMFPDVNRCPDIPYDALDGKFYLFDLIYNPEETLFMKKGLERNVKAINGYAMLREQAEASWEIWTNKYGK